MANPYLDAITGRKKKKDEELTPSQKAREEIKFEQRKTDNPYLQAITGRKESEPVQPVETKQTPAEEPEQKSFFQKVGSFLSQAKEKVFNQDNKRKLDEAISVVQENLTTENIRDSFKKLAANDDELINKSEEDLIRRIVKKEEAFEDATSSRRGLGLVQEYRNPDTSAFRKKQIALTLRSARFGTQSITGAVNLGSSLLDYLTQKSEEKTLEDINLLRERSKKNGTYNEKEEERFQKVQEALLSKQPTRDASNKIKKWSEETSVQNPDFVESVGQGTGSMAGFTLLSYLTGGNAVIPYITESISEAGSVYEENRNNGMSIEEASKRSDATLLANLVFNYFTNIYDVPEGSGKSFKQALLNARDEGVQEGYQQIVSNLATGKEWFEGVIESMGVGAVLGGATTVFLPDGGDIQIKTEPQVEFTEQVKEEEQQEQEQPEAPEVQPLQLENMDQVTTDKVQELNRLDAQNPVQEDIAGDEQVERVYQVVGKNLETDFVFKSPEEVANYSNLRTAQGDVFRAIDVRSSDVVQSEVKGDGNVFTLKEGAEILNTLETTPTEQASAEVSTATVEQNNYVGAEQIINLRNPEGTVQEDQLKQLIQTKQSTPATEAQPKPYVATNFRGEGRNVGRARYGEGLYTTPNKELAERYGDVKEVKVSLDNPYYIDTLIEDAEYKPDAKKLKELGYDGIVVLDESGSVKEVVSLRQENQELTIDSLIKEASGFKTADEFDAALVREGREQVVESKLKEIYPDIGYIQALDNIIKGKKPVEPIDYTKPRKVFHGTNAKFSVFDPKKANQSSKTGVREGHVFFTSDKEVAESYGENIIEREVSFNNPLIIDAKSLPWNDIKFEGKSYTTNELAKIAEDRGYDGLIVENVRDTGGKQDSDLPGGFKESTVFATFGKNTIKESKPKKKKKSKLSRSIPKNLQETAFIAKKSENGTDYEVNLTESIASRIKNTTINSVANKGLKNELDNVDWTKVPQTLENIEKIKSDIKKAGFDSLDDFVKASKGKAVRKSDTSFSRSERKKLKSDLNAAVLESENQDQAIDKIDAIVTLEVNKSKQPNYINRMKALRAALNRSMYEALGIAENTPYKQAYAELETLRNQEEISELIDRIEEHVQDIDGILKDNNQGYKSGISYTLNASFGDYSDAPIELGGMDTIQPIELPELLDFAKSLGVDPYVANLGVTRNGDFTGINDGRIRISRDLFTEENIEQAAKTLAHEIGHLVDWLPNKSLTRGNLLGRILSLNRFMKQTFDGVDVNARELREEMYQFSKYWRPYDESTASDNFKKYRKSGKEIYADALSGILVSPGVVEQKAPKFYKAFFENLDKKSKVKEEYFKLMDFLQQGKDKVLERRLAHIYEGFSDAKKRREAIELGDPDERTKREKARDAWHSVLRQHVTAFDPIYRKFNEWAKLNGVEVSPAEQIRQQLEEMQMRKNESYLYLDKVQKDIVKPLEDMGVSVEDLGVLLKLERNLGQRKDIANPYGLNGTFASETLDAFKTKLEKEKGITEDQFNIMVQVAKRFRDYNFVKVEEATAVGLYAQKTFDEVLKENKDTYVTYQVVDYIHDNYVSAGIKKAHGTLRAIENPFVSTILKTLAVTEQIEVQKGKRLVVNQLKEIFPEDIKLTKVVKGRAGVRVGFKPAKGMEALKLYNDGKLIAYDVDPLIAKAFETYSGQEMHNLVKTSMLFNRVFKPIVTTYNVSWGFYSNIRRDANRTYRSLAAITPQYGKKQKVTLREFLATWVKSIPDAAKFQRSQLTALTEEMLQNKAFTTPFTEFDVNANNESSIAPILRKYDFLGKQGTDFTKGRLKLLNPFKKLLDGINFAGGTLESTTKIAGYQIIKKREANGKKAGFITRNYLGTPNYIEGGSQKQIDNNVFVFSNVMIQALRTDIELATNPTTRSGFWFNMMMFDILPKIAMVAAAAGLLGDELEDLFAGMTEYDKTNYITFPVGKDPKGKTVYFRIPQDETSRLFSAITWKLGTALSKDLKKPEQILSLGVGFLPSVTPLWDIAGGWLSYIQGRNPYDDFRGRQVIDDYTWRAGGLPVFEQMVKWTTNSVGLTQFTTYDDATKSTFETIISKIPVINRAIKVSDYGKTETEREIQKDIDQKNAKRILKERETLNKHLPEAREAGEDKEKRTEIFKKVVEEVYGPEPKEGYDETTVERIKRLAKKYTVGRLEGTVSRELDSLIDANTNEYKVELLNLYKESMNKKDFKELVIFAFDNKIISESVIEELSN